MSFLASGQQTLILSQLATGWSHTGNTNETTLVTVPIPAGIMGLNGVIQLTTVWSATNNANAKTIRARLGGIGGTAFLGASIASVASARDIRTIWNKGAANSQVSYAATSISQSTTGATTTGAIDTSAAQDLVITVQLGTGSDTVTLESYIVEILRP